MQGEVDLPVFLVELFVGDVGVIGFELIEIRKLIQAQQAQFP
jgi:protein involved in polysaccharide export with SLBB domain